jgi:hypothetical protein
MLAVPTPVVVFTPKFCVSPAGSFSVSWMRSPPRGSKFATVKVKDTPLYIGPGRIIAQRAADVTARVDTGHDVDSGGVD